MLKYLAIGLTAVFLVACAPDNQGRGYGNSGGFQSWNFDDNRNYDGRRHNDRRHYDRGYDNHRHDGRRHDSRRHYNNRDRNDYQRYDGRDSRRGDLAPWQRPGGS